MRRLYIYYSKLLVTVQRVHSYYTNKVNRPVIHNLSFIHGIWDEWGQANSFLFFMDTMEDLYISSADPAHQRVKLASKVVWSCEVKMGSHTAFYHIDGFFNKLRTNKKDMAWKKGNESLAMLPSHTQLRYRA